MQISTSIEPGIDNQSTFAAFPSQRFRKCLPKSVVVHGANVDITDRPITQFRDHGPALLDPSLVKQLLLIAEADRFDSDFHAGVAGWVKNRQQRQLACFVIQKRADIHRLADLCVVYLFNDHACSNFSRRGYQRPFFNDFLNQKTVLLEIRIEKGPESRGRVRTFHFRHVIAPGVARIQFTQQFALHLGEVAVVANERQKFLVNALVVIPVYAVQIFDVEFLFHLAPDVLKKISVLRRRRDLFFRNEFDGFHFSIADLDLADAAVYEDKEVFTRLVELEL